VVVVIAVLDHLALVVEVQDRGPNHNVGKKLRLQVAERDTWICHRCRLPIDPALSWPHPLAATTDHYPISSNDGGPPIAANLKIAHSLCNGSNGPASGWRQVSVRYGLTDAEQVMIETIVKLPVMARTTYCPLRCPANEVNQSLCAPVTASGARPRRLPVCADYT
jgi:hypothetical protein